ncbi:hypothetical protein VPHD528_0042 [Vibrio phage D528]|nr:hypothetical protein MYOV002v2_p0039 [Vibrio phage 144E46.1]
MRVNLVMMDEETCKVVMQALGELPARVSLDTINNLNNQFKNQDGVMKTVLENVEANKAKDVIASPNERTE